MFAKRVSTSCSISLYRHKVIVDERTGRCTLLISKSFSDDEGQYTCTATNQAGEVSTSARLLPEGPRIKEAPAEAKPSPVQEMVIAADKAMSPAEREREFYIPPQHRQLDRRAVERMTSEPEEEHMPYERRVSEAVSVLTL